MASLPRDMWAVIATHVTDSLFPMAAGYRSTLHDELTVEESLWVESDSIMCLASPYGVRSLRQTERVREALRDLVALSQVCRDAAAIVQWQYVAVRVARMCHAGFLLCGLFGWNSHVEGTLYSEGDEDAHRFCTPDYWRLLVLHYKANVPRVVHHPDGGTLVEAHQACDVRLMTALRAERHHAQDAWMRAVKRRKLNE